MTSNWDMGQLMLYLGKYRTLTARRPGSLDTVVAVRIRSYTAESRLLASGSMNTSGRDLSTLPALETYEDNVLL